VAGVVGDERSGLAARVVVEEFFYVVVTVAGYAGYH
jgi:hypothetical protein